MDPPGPRGPVSACRRLAGATHGSSVTGAGRSRGPAWGTVPVRCGCAAPVCGSGRLGGWPGPSVRPSLVTWLDWTRRIDLDSTPPPAPLHRGRRRARRGPGSGTGESVRRHHRALPSRPRPSAQLCSPNRTRARDSPRPLSSSSSSCSGRRSAGLAHFPPPSSPPPLPRPAAATPRAPSPNPSLAAAAAAPAPALPRRPTERVRRPGQRRRPPPLPYGGVPPRWNALVRCHFSLCIL